MEVPLLPMGANAEVAIHSIFDLANRPEDEIIAGLRCLIKGSRETDPPCSVNLSWTRYKFTGQQESVDAHMIKLGGSFIQVLRHIFLSWERLDPIQPLLINEFFGNPDNQGGREELNRAFDQAAKITLYLSSNPAQGPAILECHFDTTIRLTRALYLRFGQPLLSLFSPEPFGSKQKLEVVKRVCAQLSVLKSIAEGLEVDLLFRNRIPRILVRLAERNDLNVDICTGLLHACGSRIQVINNFAYMTLKTLDQLLGKNRAPDGGKLQTGNVWVEARTDLDKSVRRLFEDYLSLLIRKAPNEPPREFDEIKDNVQGLLDELTPEQREDLEKDLDGVKALFKKMEGITFERDVRPGAADQRYTEFKNLGFYDWVDNFSVLSLTRLEAEFARANEGGF